MRRRIGPLLRQLIFNLRPAAATQTEATGFVPDGHFYSPIPSLEDAERAAARAATDNCPYEIAIDAQQMIELWHRIGPATLSMPFSPHKKDTAYRYFYENDMYSYGDAAVYFGLVKMLRPKRIIEIGSGYSSALALDMREFFELATQLTFIEPFPSRLMELLRDSDRRSVTVLTDKVQNVPPSLFHDLEENDILFIDSSHVAKTGSDVCYELFEILPRLKLGVVVHFHDCFWPFEYPSRWIIKENRGWNELYFLRAFLMYNTSWRIEFFNSYFVARHRDEVIKHPATPLLKNPGGGLWLRRAR